MDKRGNGSSGDVPKEEHSTARLPEWARERADGEWYGPRAADRSSQRAEPKAPANVIVVVPDEEGNEWAKARVFDNPGEAAALVQMLVEEGLAPERVSIFSGRQLVVDVAYQSVVELKESQRRRKSRG